MAKGKKRKRKTPQRKSTRVKKRSEKGVYYDEHYLESTSPLAANNNITNDKEYNALELTGNGHVKPIAASTVECTTPVANESATPGSNNLEDAVVPAVPVIPAVHSRRSEEPGIAPDTATPTIPLDIVSQENVTPTLSSGAVDRSLVTPSTPVITRVRSRSEPARPLNLKLEIEMATSPSQLSPPVTNTHHILPRSVMVVDSQFTREIHFTVDAREETQEEPETSFSGEKSYLEEDDVVDIDHEMEYLHSEFEREDQVMLDEDTLILCGLFDLKYDFQYENVFDMLYHGPAVVHVKPVTSTCPETLASSLNHSGSTLPSTLDEAHVSSTLPTNAGGCLLKKTTEETSSKCLLDKFKNEAVLAENEALKKAVYEKSQELKFANDRVSQLQNSNTYRREVARLEEVVENNERELKCLKDELILRNQKVVALEESVKFFLDENKKLEKSKEELILSNQKIVTLEESVTFFLNENTQLKNTVKAGKEKKCMDACTQISVSDLPQCEKCVENDILISKLNEYLEMIDQHTDVSQSSNTLDSVSQRDIDELVDVLDTIEKKLNSQNVMSPSNNIDSVSSASRTINASGTAYIPSKNDTSLHHVNRFRPLQHLNNGESRGPSSPKPLRPGPHLYSEMVKNTPTTMILTDSMAGGIKMNNIKKNIGVRDRTAVIKRFPGHTAEEIACYAPKPLNDSKPDQVIIIAGTNDLTRSIYEKGTVDELKVVDNVLNIGRAARHHGAKKIHISSIMARRGHRYSEIVKSVNNLLFMACMVEDFLFIDQDDIKLAHISSDGIHLNTHGTAILMFNIFSVFSAFNSSYMDFKEDYDYAMSLC